MTPSMTRTRLLAGLALAAVFAAGVAVGLGAARFLQPPRPEHPDAFGPLKALRLTDPQLAEVNRIIERHAPEVDRTVREVLPKLRAVQDAVEVEVRGVLTEEQRRELDQIKSSRPPVPPMGPPLGSSPWAQNPAEP